MIATIMLIQLRWVAMMCLCAVWFRVVRSSTAQKIQRYDTELSAGDYNTAFNSCKQKGMLLPMVESVEKNKELQEALMLTGVPFSWLGLTLPGGSTNPADFRWSDGTTLSWEGWQEGEPDISNGKCVAMVVTHWHVVDCDVSQTYICQEASSVTPVNMNTSSSTPYLSFSRGIFTLLPSHSTTGQPLAVVQFSSLMRCAAECLHTSSCDVISVASNETCSLFPSYSLQLTSTPSYVVYQKMSAK